MVRVRYAVRKWWAGRGSENYNSLNQRGKDSIMEIEIQIIYVLVVSGTRSDVYLSADGR
jgi:hypothetical protein